MPFLSVSKCALRLQRLQLSLLLLIPACLLFPAVARAQVTYTGSGAVDFGSQAIGAASAATALDFTFSSSTIVGSIQVVTQGATELDFTNAGTGSCTAGIAYSAGAICTIGVTFKPTLPGTRYGAAELLDSSGNVLATGYLQGAGIGPQVNFLPGTQSKINTAGMYPEGVAVDATGNVYIASSTTSQVFKETLSAGGYTESTISGVFDYPIGIAVDGAGNVYIADTAAGVLKETLSGGSYTQSVVNSQTFPDGVAVDGAGNVYISNRNTNYVLKETLSGNSYTGSLITAALGEPMGLAVDQIGNLYVADLASGSV
jgi:hypothetical protein